MTALWRRVAASVISGRIADRGASDARAFAEMYLPRAARGNSITLDECASIWRECFGDELPANVRDEIERGKPIVI